jgi:hypothetical protein
MEYNANVPPSQSRCIACGPAFTWEHTDYLGASLLALARVSKRKGYCLVYCERRGVNAFFEAERGSRLKSLFRAFPGLPACSCRVGW